MQGDLLRSLVDIQYERNEINFSRGKFRVRGDVIEVFPAYLETALRIEFFGDKIDKISEINPLTGRVLKRKNTAYIYPAKHFVTTAPRREKAIKEIRKELDERLKWFDGQGKPLEAERLKMRTNNDIEMMQEIGVCHGVENYSRHLSGRKPGQAPACLINYFPKDFLLIIDESHVAIPQIRGMYAGDRSRKENLINYGFRLPSALDNRPLKFNEFEKITNQVIYLSATPGPYELEKSKGEFIEQIIRPTGLVDPIITVKPIEGQIKDLIFQVKQRIAKKQRTLITTLTKRMAEDLSDYLHQEGLCVRYLHSEINVLKRIEILQSLRKGDFDVLVGINLLREGLDLPEVSLVIVLDADKEGFLRSETSLIQVCGRAARNVDGEVIMYADSITGSMERAIKETRRRRKIQTEYNEQYNITPQTIQKAIREGIEEYKSEKQEISSFVFREGFGFLAQKEKGQILNDLKRQMKEAANELDFELAIILRDKINQFNKKKK
jgi:excinuclease ABC subunit B